jgi:hypothetical protein
MLAPAAVADTVVLGDLNSVEGKVLEVPSHKAINEQIATNEKSRIDDSDDGELRKDGVLVLDKEIEDAPPLDDEDEANKDDGYIIITGTDAANHLLPMRDDYEPALTFRSLFLATVLSCFQAVMYQIYMVSSYQPTQH